MKYLFKTYTVQSLKNGTVRVEWFFGSPRIYAGGSQQSGPYVRGLWKAAVQRVPTRKKVRSLLMLGLGGGCAWPMLEKEFPNAEITVIEWDDVMVSLAREFERWEKEPKIIVGDVCEILPTMRTTFDVILDDAFYGATPEVRVAEEGNVSALAQVLSPGGYLVVNVSENKKLIESLSNTFTLIGTWMFRENTIAMFTH